MNKHWLQAFAIRGHPRIYDECVLPGFEAILVEATDTQVTVATHNLFKTELRTMPWSKFVHDFMFDARATAENQALLLRNTMRSIATKLGPGVAATVERFLDEPPTVAEVVVNKPKKPAPAGALVRSDYHRHTCIELRRDSELVTFVPLAEGGLDVCQRDVKDFDQEYLTALPDYPVPQAAKLYVQFAQHLGASPEAMRELAQFIIISKKELDMATAKPVTATTKPAAPAKTTAAAKAKGAAAPKAAKAPKEKKPSAASRFQELIMAGKLTDDAIFEQVKKEFGLGDDKRGYVTWYRNHLRKTGKNPPAALEAKGAVAKPAKDAAVGKPASKAKDQVKPAAAAVKKPAAVKTAPVAKKATVKAAAPAPEQKAA